MQPMTDALQALQRQFAAELPARLAALRAQYGALSLPDWQSAEAQALHHLLHSLTGAAGTFGMPSLSAAARQLEHRLAGLLQAGTAPDAPTWQAIGKELERIERLAQIRLDSTAPSLAPPVAAARLLRTPRVHLVEDDVLQAERLSQALRDDGYVVRLSTSLDEFRAACASWAADDAERPDAVVMDMIFPESDSAGAELLAELKGRLPRCPPVVFASVRDDIDARLAAFRAGATRYLVKPVEAGRLTGLLDALTGRQPPQPYRVMLVDDDPLVLDAQAAMLRAAGMTVLALAQALSTLEVLDEFRPDVLVLDVYMPEASGPELAAIVRERDAYLHLPILFLSAESDMSQQLLALNLGGDDFLVKPVQPEHLVLAVTARARRARQNAAVQQRLQSVLYEREREHLALDQHAIVSIADTAGTITYVNDKFCEISGYTRDELMGQDHRIIKSGVHPPAFFEELWQTITAGRVWDGEVCNRRKDGGLYWVESTVTPFLDGEGVPYQYVSIRTDITRVKAAERAMADGVDRLNATLESTQDGILAVGADGEVLFMNRQFRDMWNMPFSPEARGGTDGELLAHAQTQVVDPQAFLDRVQALYRSQEDSDDLIELNDGRVFERHSKPLRAEGDGPGRVWSFHDITERRRAEQAAEAAKERLRRGQMYANIGTWEWNIVSGDLFWTERIAPLFGYPTGELETSYANFLAAVHPDDRQAVIDAVNACVERDVPYEIEHRVVWPDGTVRWLLERGAVQRDAAGKALNMIGVVQDIDDRKRVELALAERERELHETQSLARLGGWSSDVSSGKLTWSDEVYVIFGRDPETYEPDLTLYYRDIVHPDDVEKVRREEQAAYSHDRLHKIDHRFIRTNGSVGWVHLEGQVIRDSLGNMPRLTGTVQDITDRKRAEMALAERERQLLEAQRLASIGNWTADMVSGELLWSDEIYRIFGHAPGSFAPSVEAFHAAVHPDDRALVHASEKQAQETGRHDVVHRIQRPDGSIRHVHELAQMQFDDAGKPLRLTGTVQDVTERVEFEQALVAAREAADRANHAKSEFLSSMSHELRTPMNAILGFGQLMEYDDTLPAEHQDNVREILKAGQHLLQLINEVLDLAKVESGSIDLSLEPLGLSEVVQECLSLVGTLADRRDIRLSHHGVEGAAVRADRTRLKQVLLNLLSNAIKYNREGGSVRLEVQPVEADRLRILVRDTGLGIPADKRADLFQPFNRLGAEGSEIEGSGIGLTITRRIVEMMGGSVDVESTVGVGSTFWIELPRETLEDTAGAHAEAVHAGDMAGAPGASAEHTVLYIEDNPANIRLVAQILGRVPHIHLLTAHTPELGIELALARRPVLILLDINMPGLDGYQVLEVFKAEATLKDTPVIAITANAMPRDIQRGREAGFAEYLTKPLDVGQFLATVQRCLLPRKGVDEDLRS